MDVEVKSMVGVREKVCDGSTSELSAMDSEDTTKNTVSFKRKKVEILAMCWAKQTHKEQCLKKQTKRAFKVYSELRSTCEKRLYRHFWSDYPHMNRCEMQQMTRECCLIEKSLLVL